MLDVGPYDAEISTVPAQPTSVTATLDDLLGRSTLRAEWLGDMVVPDETATLSIGGVIVGHGWAPVSRSYDAVSRVTSARWGNTPAAGVAPLVADPVAFAAQVSALAQGSPWHGVMAQACATADQIETGEMPDPGQSFADLLLSDLPDAPAGDDDYAAVLAEYQIGVRHGVRPQLVSLVSADAAVWTPPDDPLGWVREDKFNRAESVQITCRYQTRQGSVASYTQGEDVPALLVAEPAASLAEAWLEIVLQRLQLLANSKRGSLTALLDPHVVPGMAVSVEGDAWLVARVRHQIARGSVPRTVATLRPIPPAPPAQPDDLLQLPQLDRPFVP